MYRPPTQDIDPVHGLRLDRLIQPPALKDPSLFNIYRFVGWSQSNLCVAALTPHGETEGRERLRKHYTNRFSTGGGRGYT